MALAVQERFPQGLSPPRDMPKIDNHTSVSLDLKEDLARHILAKNGVYSSEQTEPATGAESSDQVSIFLDEAKRRAPIYNEDVRRVEVVLVDNSNLPQFYE